MTTARDESIPASFLWLGGMGAIPFVAGALGMWFAPLIYRGPVLLGLTGYAMVILSFVGALHWGVAMQATTVPAGPRAIAAIWSVVPALIASGSLFFEPKMGLLLMAATFVAQLAMDRWLVGRFSIPRGFLAMRSALTAAVVVSLAAAAVAL